MPNLGKGKSTIVQEAWDQARGNNGSFEPPPSPPSLGERGAWLFPPLTFCSLPRGVLIVLPKDRHY